MCPDTLRYQACLPACTSQSCPNHDFDSDPDQCSGLTEGCVCPEGTLLHRPYSALCISPEKCGKSQNNRSRGLELDVRLQHEVVEGICQLITNELENMAVIVRGVCVCLQPAPTALEFLVRTVRCGKRQMMPAACTAATMTPSSLWSTTAPAWRCPCAAEQAR